MQNIDTAAYMKSLSLLMGRRGSIEEFRILHDKYFGKPPSEQLELDYDEAVNKQLDPYLNNNNDNSNDESGFDSSSNGTTYDYNSYSY